jgi:translation initiation factor RLI1
MVPPWHHKPGLITGREGKTPMAKMIKGSTRYVLLRGKDEHGENIVIDIFNKKQLDEALKEGRIVETDNVVKIQVVGKAPLKEKNA